MPWSTPTSPTAGTVITVAWATANVVNPLIWLRNLTGGVDPPGAGYVARSSSTTNTNWFDLTGALAGLQSSINAIAPVPSGLVAAFRTAAEIASGWTRETNLDGRILIGAGTAGGQTFTEATNYGANWTVTSSSVSSGSVSSGGGSTATGTHDHTVSLIPPSRAYVFARKT